MGLSLYCSKAFTLPSEMYVTLKPNSSMAFFMILLDLITSISLSTLFLTPFEIPKSENAANSDWSPPFSHPLLK